MSGQHDKSARMLHVWLCICMFLSGFSALVYEVAWLRLMSLTLGSTAYATSCALAIFLLGLAVGAYLGGRLADSLSLRPLKIYALVEVGIGLSAAIVSPVLAAAPTMILGFNFHGSFGQIDPVVLIAIFSCILLLLPTTLMGATLPFILKQIGEYAPPHKCFGHIYGFNTLGAVFGSLAAAFVGFGYLGIYRTIIAAVLINCVIGLLSFIVSLCLPRFTKPESKCSLPLDADLSSSIKTNTSSENHISLGLVCLLAFSSGYSSLTFEVVWVKLLCIYNSSLTYAFTVMISTFLLGLGLGSLIYEKLIEKKDKSTPDRLLRFANLQYLTAIASSGCLIGIPVCLLLSMRVYRSHGNILTDPFHTLQILFLNSIICILLPATLMGTLFPILGTMAASSGQRRFASRVGIVYAVNTLGCILGSIISGLILVPLIGSYDTFQLAILLAVLCSAWVVSKDSRLGRNKKLAMTLLPVVLAICFYLFVKFPFHHFVHAFGKDRMLSYGEDTTGTIFVIYFADINAKQIVVNGTTLSTTVLPARRYMRMLGHLPVLLHPDPKRVMIACFGTGTTAGAASVHPEVKHLDIVELSNLMIKNGSLFSDTNHNVLKNPKTRVYIADARHFLLAHNTKFDIISMEPPPPIHAGVVSLYTTEFYKLVAARLNDNGVFAQWVPLEDTPAVLWKMMLQSGLKVFPYTSIWLPFSGEALLIASKSPIRFDTTEIRKRILGSPTVQASLKDVGFDDPESILSTYIMSDKSLRNFVGDVSDVSDDRPSLEFFFPYLGACLRNSDILKYASLGIPEIVHTGSNFNLEVFKRHKEALVLSLTIDPAMSKEKKKQIFDRIDILEPDNNMYRFLRKVWLEI